MSIMMRITSTLIWLRELSEMKAEGFEDSLCTDLGGPPPPPPLSLPPLMKNRRRPRGVCDSALLIVYGGHVFFPGCVENDLIGCYS